LIGADRRQPNAGKASRIIALVDAGRMIRVASRRFFSP